MAETGTSVKTYQEVERNSSPLLTLAHSIPVSSVTRHNAVTFNWPWRGEEEEEEKDTGRGDGSSGEDKSWDEGDESREEKELSEE